MACNATNDICIEALKNLIGKLSPDEKEKGLLLTGKADFLTINGIKCLTRDHLVTNADYWTEIMFLLQRFDLLKLMHSSEKDVFEQVENRSYFPIVRRLLVKIYDAIPEEKEGEFCSRIWKEIGQPEEPIALSLAQTLLRVEKCIHVEGFVAFCKLRDVLGKMDFTGAVSELDRYCECNDISSSMVNYYPMEKSPCGKCLIINNKNVKGEPERKGSEIDVDLLKETFQKFNFDVKCFEDLTHTRMLEVLRNLAQEDHSNFCAFICCIMSHGENGVVYGTDGYEVKIHDIRMTFCSCATLIGKPKIFFYQACRGQNFQRGDESVTTDGPASTMHIEDSQKDCLTGMATVEGNVAFRNPNIGSYFIKSLVKGLNAGEPLSATHILVNADLAKIQFPLGMQYISQTSEWVSTLTRDLKFRKKRD